MPDREYRRQVYYPSAKVVLIPRFDDFKAKPVAPPKKRAPIRRGTGKDNKASLEVQFRNGAFVLLAPSDDPSHIGGPQEQKGKDDFEVVAIPKSAQLGRNGPRTAGTLQLEFKYRDMPIDPRTIRSCAVEFYLGTVSAEDFQAGVGGKTRTTGNSGSSQHDEPLHVIPSGYTDSIGQLRSNLRFQGFVDEWETSWADGEPVVRVQCTDNTRLLIDQFAPPQLSISPKLKIHEGIARYLANFPQFRGLQVRFLGQNPPVLGDALAKTAYQPKLGPSAKGGDSKMNVWDYLTDITGSLGLIIRFEGTTIIVQRPRTLFKGTRSERREDDPYRPRRLPSGRVLERRTFIYGRNLEDLTVKRNFTRFAPQNVEVRCYSGKRKKTLVARFPMKADRQADVKPGDSSEEKWLVVRVRGIEDEVQLKVIAQSVYESVGRNELNVQFTTRNLSSYGGGNDDPDVLDMMPGDGIDIQTTRDEEQFVASTVTGTEEQMVLLERAQQFMRTLGFSQEFAARYAEAFVQVGVQSVFRVRKVGIDWNESDGASIEVEAVNYVVVRADKSLPENAKPEPEPEDSQQGQDPIVNIVVND